MNLNVLAIFFVTISVVLIYAVTTKAEDEIIEMFYLPPPPARANLKPCNDSRNILWTNITYYTGLPPDEENQYPVHVTNPDKDLNNPFVIEGKLDSEGTITLLDKDVARLYVNGLIFHITPYRHVDELRLKIKGPKPGVVPYITSFMVNHYDFCKKPNIGFYDSFIEGVQESGQASLSVPDSLCGLRKVTHTELIVNGLPTKPGDWPWHAALYKLNGPTFSYICGGTLIAKFFVMTAGHCVVSNGSPLLPEILSVVLGKYNLKGGDITAVEKEVHKILLHHSYDPKLLSNDIALLKLKTEVKYNDYIQPACLWQPNLAYRLSREVLGSVVGWGFDHTDQLSSQLHQVQLPMISEASCYKSNPTFFGRLLNDKKFCAGYLNGTSACNGDSGGGFVILVEGRYHVRGLVSSAVARLPRTAYALCDPTQYALFTDVEQYLPWIHANIKMD